jgi:Transcriptional regulator, AbiEi antitoxin
VRAFDREAFVGWEEVARRQDGLITRAQAREFKLTAKQVERLVLRGTWERVYPSVYRVAGAPRAWPSTLLALQLWAGPGPVVSHEAAAALWELDDFPREKLELSWTRRLEVPSGVLLHRVRSLPAADLSKRKGVRLTGIERTLLDLVATIDERRFERAFDQALSWRLTTVQRLKWCLARTKPRGKQGIGLFRTLLANRERYGLLESPLESDFEGLRRNAGLPEAEHNEDIFHRDRFLARVDFAWPSQRVIVQTHGAAVHRQEKVWHTDQLVQNQLQAAGWRVYVVTMRMIDSGRSALLDILRPALGQP